VTCPHAVYPVEAGQLLSSRTPLSTRAICTQLLRPALFVHSTLSPLSVASFAALSFPQFVHLGYPLLELDVLALLVGMSLVLRGLELVPRTWQQDSSGGGKAEQAHLTLPWQEIRLVSTPIEGNQEVCTAVSVGHGQLRGRHLLAGRLC